MIEPAFSEPFHEPARQREADRLGMLIFLASEIMLFGGIFAAALVLRVEHPADYAASASKLNLWLGTANTAILLTSSLLAAIAVEVARSGASAWAGRAMGGAALLGGSFLILKGTEYIDEYRHGLMPGGTANFATPNQHLFMNFYYAGTGLHAVHVATGICLLCNAALKRSAREDRSAVLIGNVALYWHVVDIVWIFLFPTLYLAGVK